MVTNLSVLTILNFPWIAKNMKPRIL